MTATNFYEFLNGLLSEDEKSLVLPALRQDPFIFTHLQSSEAVENLKSKQEFVKTKLYPGVFAIAAATPDLLVGVLKAEKLPAALLEKVMTSFESYKQNNNRLETLEAVVHVSLALIEKRKIVSHWKLVLNDVFRGKSTRSENEMIDSWRTILMIVSQVDARREEIFEALAQTSGPKVQKAIFVHCVLSQPVSPQEKIQQLVDSFGNHPEKDQITALELIQLQAGQQMAADTAKGLLAAKENLHSGKSSTSDIWSSPADYLNQAIRLQNLGLIASMAQDDQKALFYVDAANDIIGKYKTGLDVQKIGALVHTDQKEERTTAVKEVLKQNSGDEAVLSELLMAIDPIEDGAVISAFESEESPALDFAKTKSMEAVGNAALARESAAHVYKLLSANPDMVSPRFSRNFSLQNVFDSLVRLDLHEEAAGAARKLLEQSPADWELVKKSAPVFFKAGDYSKALDLYQWIEFVNPSSIEVKRTKALIFEHLGDDTLAYQSWQVVTELSEPAGEEDLLHLADTANRLGETDAAIEAANAIPEGSEFYGKALIALSKSYRHLGNKQQAIQSLAKAIETEVDNEEPWLVLADLYSESGETERSIDTLKAARSVFPDAKEIPFELAKRLLAKNSPSEALTLLTDLTYRFPDFLAGQVLTVETMKALNHEGVETTIDELSTRFPESAEINYLKGQQYLNNGFRNEARTVLSKVISSKKVQPEWLAAYADALAGEDYRTVRLAENSLVKDIASAQKALDQSGLTGIDPLAAAVQAEILLDQEKASEAFKSISQLESRQVSPDSEWYWRLQAGMARAATVLGKFDVALASIEDAINRFPGLVGLQQVLSEVHKASGDTLAAIEAANQVLMIAPDVVENVLWFTNFLNGLGRQDEAEKELKKAISRKPEEIKYRLALANLLVSTGREAEIKNVLGNVEVIGKSNLEEADLIEAAGLYLKANDLTSTAVLLKDRIRRNPASEQAKIDLAGVLNQNHQVEQAYSALESEIPSGNTTGLALIKAQMDYEGSSFEPARTGLSKIVETDGRNFAGLQSQFLPESWNDLLVQPDAVAFLKAKNEFALGEFQLAAETAQTKSAKISENDWMIFMHNQALQALGGEKKTVRENVTRDTPSVVKYALAQRLIDAGETGQALQLIDTITTSKDEAWEGALRTQVASIRGELIEADVNASDLDRDILNDEKCVKADEIAKVRSLILASLALWQWNDALKVAAYLYHSCSNNKSNAALYLKVIVSTLENAESSRGLGTKAHAPSDEALVNARKEIPELITALEGCALVEANRWILRGKLILEPEAANIRALAMITPQPGDITAMMNALHNMGDDATAVQVAKKFENHPLILAALARNLESSDLKKALNTLTRSLQISEAQPDTWVARSMIEEKLGEKELAIQSMENALSYWPEETEWHVRAAQLWQAAGDVKKSVAHLKLASEQEQQDTEVQYRIGSAYLSLGKLAESIQILETASANEVNRSDILDTLADAYHQSGNVEKALKTAEKAGIANPFSVKPLLLTGEIALEKGETNKALEYARQAISRNEKNADAITFLAKVLLKKGDKSQALAALEKAAAGDEATLDLMLKHAHLVREIKGAADSRSIFEGLVCKYPQNVELLKLLAESQLECGDKVAAEETARHSLRLEADQPDLHAFLGKLKFENGNLDQAIHHFSEQISLDKGQINGYLNLAKVYQQQREYHKALDTLQQAINTDSQDSRSYLAAASLLKDAKDYASAEMMLRKAAEIDPNDVSIKRQLGAVIALNLVHKSQQESSKL